MVNVFLDDTPLPVTKPGRSQDVARRVFGATFAKRMLKRAPEPGRSIPLLPQAELPDDLGWAEPNASVAGAYAGFAAVIDEADKRVFRPAVRDLVTSHINSWRGEDMGVSRGWVEDAVPPTSRSMIGRRDGSPC